MSANDISVNKDLENDVLYVMKKGFNKSRTINIGVNADVLLRLESVNRSVVGLTIENFSEVFPDLKTSADYLLMEHFDTLIELLNASHKAMCKA